MKYRNEQLKLKKILSCRFEGKLKDQGTNLPWGMKFIIVFFEAGSSEEHSKFKVHFVCFYNRENSVLKWQNGRKTTASKLLTHRISTGFVSEFLQF